MTLTLEEFYKKHGLENFSDNKELNRIEFIKDFEKIMEQIAHFFELIAVSRSKWSTEVILSAAYLNKKSSIPPVQSQIAECVGERDDKLSISYEHLENEKLLIKQESGNRNHILLNINDYPELKLISEIVVRYWKCRKDRKRKVIDDW